MEIVELVLHQFDRVRGYSVKLKPGLNFLSGPPSADLAEVVEALDFLKVFLLGDGARFGEKWASRNPGTRLDPKTQIRLELVLRSGKSCCSWTVHWDRALNLKVFERMKYGKSPQSLLEVMEIKRKPVEKPEKGWALLEISEDLKLGEIQNSLAGFNLLETWAKGVVFHDILGPEREVLEKGAKGYIQALPEKVREGIGSILKSQSPGIGEPVVDGLSIRNLRFFGFAMILELSASLVVVKEPEGGPYRELLAWVAKDLAEAPFQILVSTKIPVDLALGHHIRFGK